MYPLGIAIDRGGVLGDAMNDLLANMVMKFAQKNCIEDVFLHKF